MQQTNSENDNTPTLIRHRSSALDGARYPKNDTRQISLDIAFFMACGIVLGAGFSRTPVAQILDLTTVRGAILMAVIAFLGCFAVWRSYYQAGSVKIPRYLANTTALFVGLALFATFGIPLGVRL